MKRFLLPARVPFLIAGLLIGFFLTLHLKSDITPTSSFALDEYELQQELILSFSDEQAMLQAELNLLRQELEEIESATSQAYSAIDDDYRQELRQQLALTEVLGSGVEVVLGDAPGVDRTDLNVSSSDLVQAADLRDVINVLRTFSDDPISVNGQRITAHTPITSAGRTILINNFSVSAPFTISMVTDVPNLVIQKLSDNTELPSIYSRYGTGNLTFKFKTAEDLGLPSYLGTYTTLHLTAQSNGEETE